MYKTKCLTVTRATFRLYLALACLVKSRVVNLTIFYKRALGSSLRSILRTMFTRHRRLKAKSKLSGILLVKSVISHKTFVILLILIIKKSNVVF